jgi:hypothetical protein
MVVDKKASVTVGVIYQIIAKGGVTLVVLVLILVTGMIRLNVILLPNAKLHVMNTRVHPLSILL